VDPPHYHSPMRLLLLLLLALPAAAQVLTTEVWVGKLDMGEGRFAVSELKNISNHAGYDNQPAFFPDGQSLLFSTEADGLAETGLGVHAVRYWLESGKREPLVKVRGFSPTPTADARQITTLREGTVWLYDLTGKPLRALLPQVKTAGYYTRMDERRWVLFMNEKERHIALWNGETLERLVPGAITAPYRIPGTDAVSFVVQEEERKRLMRMELTGNSRVLAEIPFPTGGAHAWTARGTLLMASGNAIHEWNPRAPEAWPVVHRFTEPDLQGITRIALSPAADRIALVSVPNDLIVLRESRDAVNSAFAESVAKFRGTSWERTADRFELSGETATERGTSVRRWGSTEIRNGYTVRWRRTISGNGTPVWTAETEEYAARRTDAGGSTSRFPVSNS
jgi:hypothetical protein